jgi:hypothetical protein
VYYRHTASNSPDHNRPDSQSKQNFVNVADARIYTSLKRSA